MREIKEWVKISSAPGGGLLTVTLVSGNHTAKASVKFHRGQRGAVKRSLTEARGQAHEMLNDLFEVLEELEAAA